MNILKTEMYKTQPWWWRTRDKKAQRNIFSPYWIPHSTPCICVTDTVNGLENCKTCIFWPRVKDNLSKQLAKIWLLFKAVTPAFQEPWGKSNLFLSAVLLVYDKCYFQFPKKVGILNILLIYNYFWNVLYMQY